MSTLIIRTKSCMLMLKNAFAIANSIIEANSVADFQLCQQKCEELIQSQEGNYYLTTKISLRLIQECKNFCIEAVDFVHDIDQFNDRKSDALFAIERYIIRLEEVVQTPQFIKDVFDREGDDNDLQDYY